MSAQHAPPDYRPQLAGAERNIQSASAANSTSLHALVVAIVAIPLFLVTASHRILPFWGVVLPILAAAASGRWHARNRAQWLRLTRLQSYFERGLARMENEWPGKGFTGEEFRTPNHVYDADLGILGKGSLFELLCTARTGIGRRRLAEYLLEPRGVAEAIARQAAVAELAPQHDLRQRIAMLGKFDFQESSWEVFSGWIAAPPLATPAGLRLLMLASTVVLALELIVGVGTGIPWKDILQWMVPVIAFRMAVAWYYQDRTRALNAAANRIGVEIGVVKEGLKLVASLPCRATKLLAIREKLNQDHAAATLRGLERLTNALTDCEKPQFDLLSQALNLRTQICFEIERWKAQHAASLAEWLDAWGEFEALAALSGYAAEHPDDAFPEFAQGETSFHAQALGHPLLPADACVRNDVILDPSNRFYVVSGSNMAGKSTLLRSIGIGVVLAYAGAPVRASSLRLTKLEVCASLSIVDSILEGKSKFLAEVDRIRIMLERARQTPVLFLIDEILSGTNSRDRRIASEAVVRGLVANGAIGALSTHDLALTEIADLSGLSGSNVHMGTRTGRDPMDFDYLLKPGVTRERNALAIAIMMGVDIGSATTSDSPSPA